MILHTINKSPFDNHSFTECLQHCQPNCSVLLIEDGVYAAQQKTTFSDIISQRVDINFYALKADILARGLEATTLSSVTIIDDAGFVELAVNHHTVQSWF
ncbi:MAG: sulfurtransferase complex subunit TusB [Spongiibacteraceae bacterium]|jgi:tRNA 2-thiouridine synthesizing protein B